MSAKVNLLNHRYGRLTVLEEVGRKYNKVLWKCMCDCGNTTNLTGNALRKGNTKSCGCLNKERTTTHGYSNHPLYKVWGKMIHRCTEPTAKDYKSYGGRGIIICTEWYILELFIEWALANGWKKGLQIDREDNDGNYTPENCRFTTRIINMNNRRKSSTNKSGYTGVCFHKGEGKFQASLYHKGKRVYLGYHTTAERACVARDFYIVNNKLPHKVQTK